MPKSEDSHEDFNPKHRIVGAIVLVLLVVILIPRILDKQELSEQQSVRSPNASPSTKVLVTTVKQLQQQKSTDMPADIPTTQLFSTEQIEPAKAVLETKQATVEPKTSAVQEQKSTKEKAGAIDQKSDSDSKIATIIKKGWVVQLGTYSKSENAYRLRDRLLELGYQVYQEEVRLKQGKMLRVRAGPFRDESEAKRIQARILSELAVEGVVVKLP